MRLTPTLFVVNRAPCGNTHIDGDTHDFKGAELSDELVEDEDQRVINTHVMAELSDELVEHQEEEEGIGAEYVVHHNLEQIVETPAPTMYDESVHGPAAQATIQQEEHVYVAAATRAHRHHHRHHHLYHA